MVVYQKKDFMSNMNTFGYKMDINNIKVNKMQMKTSSMVNFDTYVEVTSKKGQMAFIVSTICYTIIMLSIAMNQTIATSEPIFYSPSLNFINFGVILLFLHFVIFLTSIYIFNKAEKYKEIDSTKMFLIKLTIMLTYVMSLVLQLPFFSIISENYFYFGLCFNIIATVSALYELKEFK